MGGPVVSTNEREFVVEALRQGIRADGRSPFDFRTLDIRLGLDDASAEVTLGATRVVTVVTAELVQPFSDRPSEGMVSFNVEFGPMAGDEFDAGAPGEAATRVARAVERGIKESRALDLEALCVVAGRRVWSLRVDIHALDNGGNLADACMLSCLAGLLAFRRPEVEVGGDGGREVRVVDPKEREPVPLTIHHMPISVTVALFDRGRHVAVDPTLAEEAAAEGYITAVVNGQREVCAVDKRGRAGVPTAEVMRCLRVASTKAEEMAGLLSKAVAAHKVARVQARVRRHVGGSNVGKTELDGVGMAAKGVGEGNGVVGGVGRVAGGLAVGGDAQEGDGESSDTTSEAMSEEENGSEDGDVEMGGEGGGGEEGAVVWRGVTGGGEGVAKAKVVAMEGRGRGEGDNAGGGNARDDGDSGNGNESFGATLGKVVGGESVGGLGGAVKEGKRRRERGGRGKRG